MMKESKSHRHYTMPFTDKLAIVLIVSGFFIAVAVAGAGAAGAEAVAVNKAAVGLIVTGIAIGIGTLIINLTLYFKGKHERE